MPTRLPPFFLSALIAVLPCVALAGDGAGSPEEAAQRYFRAEAQFDLDALKGVLDPQFVEISPLGEVDEHDKVLSFYTPDQKVDAPPMQFEPYVVRRHGDFAVISTRATMTVKEQSRSMTVGLTARRDAGGWKLLSAQYTVFRPKAAPPAGAKPGG
ncbi:MAG TPA: nuclear transport factor 2 family protein [Pseudoxanthomonas sp.]|nr:nuclear transport factor 2 family protein [Pseudoxanthomonas sp.]